jgi:hypothetical protein
LISREAAPHLSLEPLDTPGGGNASAIGGIVIREEATPVHLASWGTLKLHYR